MSIQPGAEQLWRMQNGAHGDRQTEDLQDSYGMQGRGCLARSTISFGRESGCQLTGFGRETWTVPPSGGVSWAQVHRDCSLHLGNAHVPPGSPAVEGSEDGGCGQAASGCERGFSAPHALPGRKAPEQNVVVSCAPLQETNHPAARARDWVVC